jgi:hypothetical protein
MAKHELYGSQIGAVLQQHRSKAVAQRMRRDVADAGLLPYCLVNARTSAAKHGATALDEDEVVWRSRSRRRRQGMYIFR